MDHSNRAFQMENPELLNIVVADDHPLFRDALCNAIEVQLADANILVASNFAEVEKSISANPDIDLLLLDLNMPGADGYSGLMRLRSEYPALPILMVSASDDTKTITRLIDLGANGFIPKSSSLDQIRHALDEVLAGNVWLPPGFTPDRDEQDEVGEILAQIASLTPQQNRVLHMLADGLLNKQIAFTLNVSEATVKAHVSAVLQKLRVDSRTQAVICLSKAQRDISNPL